VNEIADMVKLIGLNEVSVWAHVSDCRLNRWYEIPLTNRGVVVADWQGNRRIVTNIDFAQKNGQIGYAQVIANAGDGIC